MSSATKVLRINGLDLKIKDTGAGDPALVFIHYWGGTSRTWDLVSAELSGHYHCVALDLRGWGESDKSAGSYDLESQADDVAAVIESLGLSHYILVGHSMGGKIAQIIGSHRPSGLDGLVLVAPAPPTPMATSEAQRKMIRDSYECREGVETALSILAEKPLSADLREQVIADTLGGAPAAKDAWIYQGALLDISAVVGSISVGVTIIVGDADRVENEAVLRRELASRVSQSNFVIMPGVGHLAPLEAPKELAAAISDSIMRLRSKAAEKSE